MKCDPAAQERAEIVQVADRIGSIQCNGTVLSATPDALATLMAGTDCSSTVNRLLEEIRYLQLRSDQTEFA